MNDMQRVLKTGTVAPLPLPCLHPLFDTYCMCTCIYSPHSHAAMQYTGDVKRYLYLNSQFLEALLEQVFALALFENVHLSNHLFSLVNHQLLCETGLVSL